MFSCAALKIHPSPKHKLVCSSGAVIVLLTSTWGQREPATGAGWRTRSGGAMGTWPRSSKEHLMIQATA